MCDGRAKARERRKSYFGATGQNNQFWVTGRKLSSCYKIKVQHLIYHISKDY